MPYHKKSFRKLSIRAFAVRLTNVRRKHMKYLLLVYMDEKAMTDTEREACYAESTQLTVDLHAQGQYLGASPLYPVATATSLRVRDGKPLVTDGPFAETRE